MKKASILMENGEKILIDLFPNEAPGTVENFEKLANEGFYNGVTFHRVIPGYSIKCETEGNPHKHEAGSLSMAHAGKDTGGSQFFLVHEPQPHLNGVHTVFGKVTEGLDTVLKMKNGDVMKEVKVWEE
jgi:peptidyl-prolyl cis-trans isomerase B (cyclophilin B)